MPKNHATPKDVAAGSDEPPSFNALRICAAGVQWFFKDEIKSHGWYTADLRCACVGFRRELKNDRGLDLRIEVADYLFSGPVLEEQIAAVFLLEKLDSEFGDREFRLFES